MAEQTKNTETLTARIPIWSPGTFTSLNGDEFSFSANDLEATAGAYAPDLFRAPWVKGHPKTDDPSQGWADSLSVEGGILYADSSQIAPAFAEEVRAGRWGKISPKFFSPSHPENPVPGTWYLRHIGWLGAAAPANKGLPSPVFAGDDSNLVAFADGQDVPEALFGSRERWGFQAIASLIRGLRDRFIEKNGLEEANKLVPDHLIREIEEAGNHPEQDSELQPVFSEKNNQPIKPEQEETPMAEDNDETAFAEQQAALNKRTEELDAREATINKESAERLSNECAAFAEQMVKEGRVLPRDQAGLAAVLNGLPAEATVEFAEGDENVTKPSAAWLRGFIKSFPPQVEFSEMTAPEGEEEPGTAFAAPDGYTVDPVADALHKKATAYQAKHPNTQYLDAVQAVS